MSALGQKRTFAPQKVMSALAPKADIGLGRKPVGDQLLQPAVTPSFQTLEWRLHIGAIIAQPPPDRYTAISASANSLI